MKKTYKYSSQWRDERWGKVKQFRWKKGGGTYIYSFSQICTQLTPTLYNRQRAAAHTHTPMERHRWVWCITCSVWSLKHSEIIWLHVFRLFFSLFRSKFSSLRPGLALASEHMFMYSRAAFMRTSGEVWGFFNHFCTVACIRVYLETPLHPAVWDSCDPGIYLAENKKK